MTLTTITTARPSVWIGCFACYNAGCLTGQWVGAEEAADITAEDIHGGDTHHEELWCFDSEGFPSSLGEMDTLTASKWGELYAELDNEDLWPALLAWVDDGAYVEEANGLPDLSTFEDAYQGQWDSFAEYATQLAEDIGLTDGWPEEAARYFDWDSWNRDLAFDYTVVDAPAGVFIFRS